MNALKSIGQVLAAIVYSCIYAILSYIIIVLPLTWLYTHDTKSMILLIFFLGGIIAGIIGIAKFLLIIPYGWIIKKNIVSLIISIGILLFIIIRYILIIWGIMSGHGTSAVIIAIIITVLFVETLIVTIFGLISMYAEIE